MTKPRRFSRHPLGCSPFDLTLHVVAEAYLTSLSSFHAPLLPPVIVSTIAPLAMAASLRTAAVDLKAAAARRLRRGRPTAAWKRRILAIALLATAITAVITGVVPLSPTLGFHLSLSNSFSSSSSSSSSADANPSESLLSAAPPPPPLSRRSIPQRNTSRPSPIRKRGSTGEPYLSKSPDEQLRYAKREIENAPLVVDDPELYAPLFRNVSVFKRSYELMERILKVYIYKDGQAPIFHTPELQGIYASEGWFMKLMEENRRFVVTNPSKAHLFYLPYSSRKLGLTLYVRNSHNLRPLSLFLRNYVNTIAAKYPFWNRTRGADHFLVACHDWGPYITTAHEELRENTIKALCNADVSEGIFVPGKDVSLPETTIKSPKNPLRNVGGGKPVSKRSFLAFYAGNMHGRVRPILDKYWGDDEDMRIYRRLPNRVSRNMSYVQHMKSTKFCICPMGYEVNSPRIVEAIYYECVPVIIADNFVLAFDEVLDWSSFSVVVAEKDIPDLKNILLGIPLRRYVSMLACGKMLQKHLLWHAKPQKYDIFHMILHSIWFNRLGQIQLQQ